MEIANKRTPAFGINPSSCIDFTSIREGEDTNRVSNYLREIKVIKKVKQLLIADGIYSETLFNICKGRIQNFEGKFSQLERTIDGIDGKTVVRILRIKEERYVNKGSYNVKAKRLL